MVVVLGVMLVLLALAAAALYLMTSQSRIAEGKVKRMRAYYAAQAGMVHALEEASNNTAWMTNITANTSFSVTPALAIGAGIDGYPAGGYNPVISVTPGAGLDGTALVNITVTY